MSAAPKRSLTPLPPRVRLDLGALEWKRLSASARAPVNAAMREAGAAPWTKRVADGVVIDHRSAPMDAAAADRVLAACRAAGMRPVAHDAPRSRHLATVLLDGRRVVLGAGRPMLDRDDALRVGVPLAVVSDTVAPWEDAIVGHTDAELRAAPLLARTAAEAGAR